MKTFRRFSFLRLLGVTAFVVLLASLAVADPVNPGTVLVNFLGTGQGTASGFFTINSTNPGQISNFDFVTTRSADCCTFSAGLPGFEYTTANSTSSIFTFANGNQQIGLRADNHPFAGGSGSQLVITFNCGGIASCLTNNLAVNNSFEVTFAEIAIAPDGTPFRSTGTVFMHVTDDPGIFSMNLDQTLLAGSTLIGGTPGGDGGGGGTSVPEPASLSLLGAGLIGVLTAMKRKK